MMDVIALVLAILAAISFAVAARPRVTTNLNLVALGLALLTVALICQFTTLTGHPVNF
jgi:hypothetical protein